ncbi:MAG: hypothetical protein EXR09_08050 [Acetobacteraceae bacterium]|nr:hypothetical protein [Acetobacteraceae bacterium]
MGKLKTQPKYSPEVRERAVRMAFDHAWGHPSQWASVSSIAAKIGYSAATLHAWVRQARCCRRVLDHPDKAATEERRVPFDRRAASLEQPLSQRA